MSDKVKGDTVESQVEPAEQAELRPIWQEIWLNRRVLGFCVLIFLLPFNVGYEIGMVGKLFAAPEFQAHFGTKVKDVWIIKAQDQQILNAANTIGIFVSAIFTGWLSDKFGRRAVLITACVICTGGIILQYMSKTVMVLFGGKVISVFGFGLGHSLGPVFVSELAPERLRGVCLALNNTMIVSGGWLASLVVYACSFRHGDSAWRIPLITQLVIPGIILGVAIPFLPESPSWLILHDKYEKAEVALRRFNGPAFDVGSQLHRLQSAIAMEKASQDLQQNSSWLDCFRGTNLRRTTIICMVFLAQQFLGSSFVSGYLAYYFSLAGVKAPLAVAQGAYAIQIFGNICSWPLIDRLGRRTMIVWGCFIMTFGLLIIGCINIRPNTPSLQATVAFMCVWGFLFQATVGAVGYTVAGETPSPRVRQKTFSINIMSSTSMSCMWGQVLPFLLNPDKAALGGKVAFVFLGPAVPVCIYMFFCLPEMKGRSVDEIEEMFQEGVGARGFRGYVCRRVGGKDVEMKEMGGA